VLHLRGALHAPRLEVPTFEETRYGNALAAGTVVIALIDTLIDKGLITRSDA
jgi:hypothetical protein